MNLAILIPSFVPGLIASRRVQNLQSAALRHFCQFCDDVSVIRAPDGLGIWNKERLINHAVTLLPPRIDTVAWIDGDLHFHNPDWPEMLKGALTLGPVVQLFSEVIRLDPYGSVSDGPHPCSASWNPSLNQPDPHCPGFAWGARREFFDHGGLYDAEVVGGGDSATFYGWFGGDWEQYQSRHQIRHYRDWRFRASRYVDGCVQYIPGLIVHSWHGDLKNRQYVDRHQILIEEGFNPYEHIRIATEGHWEWTPAAPPRIRERIHEYFASRLEDESRLPVFNSHVTDR